MKDRSKPTPEILARINPENLLVVDIPSEEVNQQKNGGWYWPLFNDKNIFPVETCERTLLVTSKDYWEEMAGNEKLSAIPQRSYPIEKAAEYKEQTGKDPFEDSKYFKRSSGYEAYRYLLEASCGLQSNDTGEEFIGTQIQKSFATYLQTRNPESWMKKIMQWIDHDRKEIRTHVIHGYRPLTEQRCGIDLMKLPREPSILLVADETKSIHKFACELLNHARKDANPASFIDVVIVGKHCTAEALEQLNQRLRRELELDHPPFNVISLQDLTSSPDNMALYNGVIYSAPLGTYPAEQDILFKQRESLPVGTAPKMLVCDLLARNVTDEATLQDHALREPDVTVVATENREMLSPQEVAAELALQKTMQLELLKKGKLACEVATKVRAEKPNSHMRLKPFAAEITSQADVSELAAKISSTMGLRRHK